MVSAWGDERLKRRELIAGKVLGDLSEEEVTQVNSLLDNDELRHELWELEKSAAALDLALSARRSALPGPLNKRLQLQAEHFLLSETLREMIDEQASQTTEKVSPPSTSFNRWREWSAWACCAVAILLALSLSLTKDTPVMTASAARAELMAAAPDLIRPQWSPGTTPFDAAVSGDVVWSNSQQSGYMLFRGMPVNNPSLEQYQLWIIDAERGKEPVDGGVFDVTSAGEVVIPITAKLSVESPQAFAITIEKPGGVVVSTQERCRY